MKIFVDENIPNRTVEELRGLGHDVLDIRERLIKGWRTTGFGSGCSANNACSSPPTKALRSIVRNPITASDRASAPAE